MKISLKVTKEHKDGSADAVVDYDKEGLDLIVQYGVIAMLKEGSENMKKKQDNKDELRMKLEDAIEAFHTVIQDIKLLYNTHGTRKLPMDEDEIAIALLGLEAKAKMVAYWATDSYEQYFKLNDYASEETKARRAAIKDWSLEDDDDGRC